MLLSLRCLSMLKYIRVVIVKAINNDQYTSLPNALKESRTRNTQKVLKNNHFRKFYQQLKNKSYHFAHLQMKSVCKKYQRNKNNNSNYGCYGLRWAHSINNLTMLNRLLISMLELFWVSRLLARCHNNNWRPVGAVSSKRELKFHILKTKWFETYINFHLIAWFIW